MGAFLCGLILGEDCLNGLMEIMVRLCVVVCLDGLYWMGSKQSRSGILMIGECLSSVLHNLDLGRKHSPSIASY